MAYIVVVDVSFAGLVGAVELVRFLAGQKIFALALVTSIVLNHEDCSSYLGRHSRLCLCLVNFDNEGFVL